MIFGVLDGGTRLALIFTLCEVSPEDSVEGDDAVNQVSLTL